jgi:glycosyltransferase involved in cell wall biosynthesis
MTLRVMQAMAGSTHGGAEAFFERLVIALREAGVGQRVVIRSDAARSARLRGAGFDPVELAFGGALDIATRWQLGRMLRQEKPPIVLSWMSRASAAIPPRWLNGDATVRVGRLGGYYDLKYYRRCDHLIANTRDIVDYVRRGGWPEQRVHYLPNFVDATPAQPVERRTLDTPDDAVVALALGRFHRNKAFDVLLAALARTPAVYLWLAGEGEARASLEADTARLGIAQRVRFLGWREDVGALMAASDMVVCPSRHEPLGNVVIEAWARRKPVIAAASAGPAALIAPERTGVLVPVDDASALAAAIGRVAGDATLRDFLIDGAYRAYADEFAKDTVVRRYIQFFEGVGGCAA